MRAQRLLLRLHLYAGIFCAPYLVIFAVSSLDINHRFGFMQEGNETVIRTVRQKIPFGLPDHRLAAALRDTLGLTGWAPRWETSRAKGTFRCKVIHPGKEFTLTADSAAERITISEKRKGFWKLFNNLHMFGGDIPNRSWVHVLWGFYQDICVVYLLFAACSGIFLFAKKRKERIAGLVVVSAFALLSLLFMLTMA